MDSLPLLKTIRRMTHEEAQQALMEHTSQMAVRRATGKPMLYQAIGLALIHHIQSTGPARDSFFAAL